MQLIQLLEVVHERQGGTHAVHWLFVELGYVFNGQLAAITQADPVKNTLGLIELKQDVQVVWEVEQVWHGVKHETQTCAMEVNPDGQFVRHDVWYRLVVELQERQAAWLVQVTHGAWQSLH